VIRDQQALDYHQTGRPGKLEVVSSKPCNSQLDLSLAYTPGVAVPCRRIQKKPEEAYLYTGRGNLVAVISNGTAVLGLGDIGPLAGKPVMEGKAVLFKRFADIDVFDLEVNAKSVDEMVHLVKLLEPTFGGINLEDIKAPECFQIEEILRRELSIPVFHDDQHGTAIISGAALLNALKIVEKKIEQIRVVFSGAGAAGIACARYYKSLGVCAENLTLCDSQGVVYKGRDQAINRYKEDFARDTGRRTLADALVDADVFVGLSVAGLVTPEMVKSMAPDPILFAMANPDPEIDYDAARDARPDAIMATGRSDYPNQVNNVLGFPFIFRGALDVRAKAINEEMKLAATQALAALATEDVPDSVLKAYGLKKLHFGRDYLIPKPFDPRVLIWEAAAVAKAAIESGVAQVELDIEEYKERLERSLGKGRQVSRMIINQAKAAPKQVVFPEGENSEVLKASQAIVDVGFATPILLGREGVVMSGIKELELNLDVANGEVVIIDPRESVNRESYAQVLYSMRRRKGVTLADARDLIIENGMFGAMMVETGDADALVTGVTQHFPDAIRPALQVLRTRDDVSRVAGLHIIIVKDQVYFLADTTVNIEPSAETLAEIAICAVEEVRRLHVDPRVAMLSFSNFGSAQHEKVTKVQKAVEILRRRAPEIEVDGEMQVDTALSPERLSEVFPFTRLKSAANVLIFPDLQSANASYKLLQRLGGAQVIGPILLGMRKPANILQLGCGVEEIVNMAAIATIQAQQLEAAQMAISEEFRTCV
jgi:malate dehydrogenase (oxaloacetate-decarboxylating)(NADP+)